MSCTAAARSPHLSALASPETSRQSASNKFIALCECWSLCSFVVGFGQTWNSSLVPRTKCREAVSKNACILTCCQHFLDWCQRTLSSNDDPSLGKVFAHSGSVPTLHSGGVICCSFVWQFQPSNPASDHCVLSHSRFSSALKLQTRSRLYFPHQLEINHISCY